MHARVGVELAQQAGELVRLDVAGDRVVEGLDAHLGTVLALHAHVDRRGGVVAHEHRRQAGRDRQLRHLARDPLA